MLKGVALMLIGAGLGYGVQERERDAERAVRNAVLADNRELRATAKTLRGRCPARVRFQKGIIFTPGGQI